MAGCAAGALAGVVCALSVMGASVGDSWRTAQELANNAVIVIPMNRRRLPLAIMILAVRLEDRCPLWAIAAEHRASDERICSESAHLVYRLDMMLAKRKLQFDTVAERIGITPQWSSKNSRRAGTGASAARPPIARVSRSNSKNYKNYPQFVQTN